METNDAENQLIISLATGDVVIQLFPDLAPLHVERVKTLARAGEYDNVAFHRVLEGFVAQTGDVQFGDLEDGFNPNLVGTGESDLPDLPLENETFLFERATVGMARSTPDSGNSQFFITLEDSQLRSNSDPNGFTQFGEVIRGMELVDQLQVTTAPGLLISDLDRMVTVDVAVDLGIGLGLEVEEAQEVALLYEAALDRDLNIDEDGLNFWIDAREAGFGIVELAGFFLESSEFEESFGDVDALSDEAYVDLLYQNVLDREGDAQGVAFWLGELAREDFGRDNLLAAFSISVENAETSAFIDSLAEVSAGTWAFV